MPERQPPWHPEVLPAGWMRIAEALGARSILDGSYLAGGTGLALHLGHRRSIDLDLFRQSEFRPERVRDQLRDMQGLRNLETDRGTVHFQVYDLKVSLLHYPYALLFPPAPFGGLSVADPRDIAGMKLAAIASRGTRRDFVDLFVAARLFGLGEVLGWFETKYASVSYSRTHLFKALTYFADAETDPMPHLLVPLEWDTVTRYFFTEVPRLVRLERAPE